MFVNLLIGEKKAGYFKEAIRTYVTLIENYYPESRNIFGTLHGVTRYAGPKEAIHHAIMRKSFGCSHFITGRGLCWC